MNREMQYHTLLTKYIAWYEAALSGIIGTSKSTYYPI